MALLARMAYTQYKRHNADDSPLPLASNRVPQIYTTDMEDDVFGDQKIHERDNKKFDSLLEKQTYHVTALSDASDDDSDTGIQQIQSKISKPIALYPQYLTSTTTSVVIDEVNFPKLNSSFEVHTQHSHEHLFTIHRDRPAFNNRQRLIDAKTQETILTIRHERGTLPAFYSFSDPTDTKILILEGNFSVPSQGSKATAIFTNAMAVSDGESGAKLAMKSSWRNHNAVICNSHTGEVLASMSSSLANVKNIIGRRRTYTVTISAGVDMALIIGMITALDARSS